MTTAVRLHDIASARAGDKGDTSIVTLWAHDPSYYGDVRREVTVERLKREFAGLIKGEISRYEMEHMHALHFVMRGALEGGVNSSLNIDAHGKSWSYLLLSLEINIDASGNV